MERGMEGETERQTETQTKTQVNEILASGVPPKGLEATCLLLEVQMVRCWVEGDGSMLCQMVWFDAK